MKVIHIITRLDMGGAQQNALYTVASLDRGRFEPVLVCGPGGALAGQGAVRTIILEDLVRPIHPARDLAALLRLTRLLAQERPAIVHTHCPKAGILGRLAAWLAGVPVIVHTHHGLSWNAYQPWWARWACWFAEWVCSRLTAAQVFVAEADLGRAEYAGLLGLWGGEYRALIRSGIKLTHYPAALTPEERERRRLALVGDADAPLVVGIGNFKGQKNVRDFLRVAWLVQRRHLEARFFYIGGGEAPPAVRALIREYGLERVVTLLPHLPAPDVAQVLAVADVYLHTALWEGLPRALLEAMKTGLPCAAYAVDGIADVLINGSNGLTAPPGESEYLAGCVSGLLSNPQLRQVFGQRAAASIGQEFDIDVMVHRQEALYEDLLSPWWESGGNRG